MGLLDRIRHNSGAELVPATLGIDALASPVGTLALGADTVVVSPANVGQLVTGLSSIYRDERTYPDDNPFTRVSTQIAALSMVAAGVGESARARASYFRDELFAREKQLPGAAPSDVERHLAEDAIAEKCDGMLRELAELFTLNGRRRGDHGALVDAHGQVVDEANLHGKLCMQDMDSIVRQCGELLANPPKGRILGSFETQQREEDIAETRRSLLYHIERAIPEAHRESSRLRAEMRRLVEETNGLSDKLATDILKKVKDLVMWYQSVVLSTEHVATELMQRAGTVKGAPRGFGHPATSHSQTAPQGEAKAMEGAPSILNIVQGS